MTGPDRPTDARKRLREAFAAQAHHLTESNALITISLPATDWPILFTELSEVRAAAQAGTAPADEKSPDDAPHWYGSVEAKFWAIGYNDAVRNYPLWRAALAVGAPAAAAPKNVTCECGRGPREAVEQTDDAGVSWWTMADHCTECLAGPLEEIVNLGRKSAP